MCGECMCAKFRCAALRIKKALGIFTELITTRTRTTRVAFGTRLPGAKTHRTVIPRKIFNPSSMNKT